MKPQQSENVRAAAGASRDPVLRRLVVIGASAGGIGALMHLLGALPADLEAAVLIVQHLGRGSERTKLPEILDRGSPFEVRLATEGATIRAGYAYVAQPGRHLMVRGDRLRLDDGEPVHHVRPAADVLFRSAAECHGAKVVGVVLTGGGKDGAAGCREIRDAGGVTIAQDRRSSSFFAMPRAAIEAGAVDRVLALDDIAPAIVEIVDESKTNVQEA